MSLILSGSLSLDLAFTWQIEALHVSGVYCSIHYHASSSFSIIRKVAPQSINAFRSLLFYRESSQLPLLVTSTGENDITTANMVHLASVPNDKATKAPLVKGMENLNIEPNDAEDEVTASVYGSRFAAQSLPLHEMPEKEMPKEVAYRMIRDDLSLDGNPMLNLASFVTTYMVLILPVLINWFQASYLAIANLRVGL